MCPVQVDLEGLVANLTAQISWFKFVGNVTLSCAAESRERDTLMEVGRPGACGVLSWILFALKSLVFQAECFMHCSFKTCVNF